MEKEIEKKQEDGAYGRKYRQPWRMN